MVMNGMFYVVVEQDVASVVNASLALTLEMDPYFDGELYGAYSSYEQAAEYANQVNL